jgi:hypothetical protein
MTVVMSVRWDKQQLLPAIGKKFFIKDSYECRPSGRPFCLYSFRIHCHTSRISWNGQQALSLTFRETLL